MSDNTGKESAGVYSAADAGDVEFLVENEPIHPDELIRFLEEKSGGLSCPLCRKQEFQNLGVGEKSNTLVVPVINAISGFQLGGHAVSAVACTNCGHILTFNRRLIEEWIRSKAGGANV